MLQKNLEFMFVLPQHKKEKRTKGNITNYEFEHKMPMIDKNTFCNVFAHLKKMMDERDDKSSFPLVKNYGCFHLSA
jgi:hypothetical protein